MPLSAGMIHPRRDVLTPEELDELNAVWDVHVEGRRLVPNRFEQPVTDRHGNQYEGRRFWSDGYRNLLDHPKIFPILQEILGDARWGHAPPTMPDEMRGRVRLDHNNIVHLPAFDPSHLWMGTSSLQFGCCKKSHLVLSFPYVCPEPVLVK
eukprot:COSAG06_NODE_987_length_11191_cov_4.011089_8_plen_151_part_00